MGRPRRATRRRSPTRCATPCPFRPRRLKPAPERAPPAMAKWLLVDGYNLAYRCFFAIPELSRADGFPTNALHGWVKSLWRLSDQEKPDGVLVFFDLGGAQDRLALHPEYKANREEMPEALSRQIPVIKDLTRAM